MLTVDFMKKSLNKAEVAYHEFALHTRQGKDGLFCFFEGERGSDNAYYVPRIKQFIEEYYPIRCGNRDKVLKVYELITIHPEYEKYKKAFFIDRDFNKPLKPHYPPIFETPCYSIENFYVSINTFKEILKNALTLSEANEFYEVCVTLFTERQKEFHQATTLFNAWYSCLIEIRNITGISTGVNLDDKLPKNFINFNLNSVSAKYDINHLKLVFPLALEISEQMLNDRIAEFSKCEQGKIFRGKYELQFVITMIELILQDSSKSKLFIKEKVKFAFGDRINNDQAIAIFSTYAETPDSLNEYLKYVTGNQ